MHPINLTPSTLEQVRKLKQEVADYKSKSLRLYIEGKNCDGFSYGVTFDKLRDGDKVLDIEGCEVLVDGDAYIFLKGSTIEWVDDERGQGFDVQNPNQSKFRGKFFKRKVWQDYLEKRNSKESEIN